VRVTALHILAQREQCARCAGLGGISICAHGDISTVTVTRLLEIGIYAVNTRIYYEKNALCVWRTFFWGGFTITSCTRPSQSEFDISRGTRLVSRTTEVRSGSRQAYYGDLHNFVRIAILLAHNHLKAFLSFPLRFRHLLPFLCQRIAELLLHDGNQEPSLGIRMKAYVGN